MSYASTHPVLVVPAIARREARPAVAGIGLVRLWRGAVRAIARTGAPDDREYGRIIESSGGKVTDSLEREAERRMLYGERL
ncbi:MAG TPA: hypothetical protein VF601_04065 [Beijerinckiaceae bacterium]